MWPLGLGLSFSNVGTVVFFGARRTLSVSKEYVIDVWEIRKVKLYGKPCSTQPQSQSSAGDLRDGTVVGGQRRGKFGKFSHSGRVTSKLSTCITDDSCKTGSVYTGCMVNGRIARAAS